LAPPHFFQEKVILLQLRRRVIHALRVACRVEKPGPGSASAAWVTWRGVGQHNMESWEIRQENPV